MRKFLFGLVLIAASFAGGAAVNSPALTWDKARATLRAWLEDPESRPRSPGVGFEAGEATGGDGFAAARPLSSSSSIGDAGASDSEAFPRFGARRDRSVDPIPQLVFESERDRLATASEARPELRPSPAARRDRDRDPAFTPASTAGVGTGLGDPGDGRPPVSPPTPPLLDTPEDAPRAPAAIVVPTPPAGLPPLHTPRAGVGVGLGAGEPPLPRSRTEQPPQAQATAAKAELEPPSSSSSQPPTWPEIRRRLAEAGIPKYVIENTDDGRFRFRGAVVDPDADADSSSSHPLEIEVEHEDPLRAAEIALRRVLLTRLADPDAEADADIAVDPETDTDPDRENPRDPKIDSTEFPN